MERYLLFDPGCSLCTQLAETIEQEAQGWLKTESLRKPSIRKLLKTAKPNWLWQPTLLEIDGEKISVFVGPTMVAKMAAGLGPRRAWHILQTLHKFDMKSQERRRFITQGGGVIGAMALFSVAALPRSFLTQANVTGWQRYHDKDYGFAVEYPTSWSVTTAEKQPTPLIDVGAIIKRLIFSSANSYIYVDLWLTNGQDFSSWLKWYADTRSVKDLPTTPTAQVTGRPAIPYLETGQPDWMSFFFSDGQYVYRIIGTLTNVPEAIQAYWHILDSFSLPGKMSLAASIPPDIRQEVEQVAGGNAPLVNACCTYTYNGNPFDCCVNGNCVWWVYYKMASVPFTGNAGTWWGQVPNFSSWARHTTTPILNNRSIAWQSGNPGHVAYINNYTGGANVTISDMCCGPDGPLPLCWDCARTVVNRPKSDYSGFIYRKTNPQPTIIGG